MMDIAVLGIMHSVYNQLWMKCLVRIFHITSQHCISAAEIDYGCSSSSVISVWTKKGMTPAEQQLASEINPPRAVFLKFTLAKVSLHVTLCVGVCVCATGLYL